MRRVLVTGGAGFLGAALIRSALDDWECHATARRQAIEGATAHSCNLADAAAVDRVWRAAAPELVIHTAYGVADPEADIWKATRNVADACARSGAALLHMSTDLVLDGETGPYTELAEPRPVHDYGRWKARAEDYVRERLPSADIVRTSLITSFAPPDPRTEWVVSGLRGELPLTLFVDEIRCPILVEDLARQIQEIVTLPGDKRGGIWHLAGPEALSRFALGALIAAAYRLPLDRLRLASSRDMPDPRPRELRLLTPRADRELATRPRPVSVAAGEALANAHDPG